MSDPAVCPSDQSKGSTVTALWTAAVVAAAAGALGRHADGGSFFPSTYESALAAPLLAIWLFCRCGPRRGAASLAADRWLTALVLLGGVTIASLHARLGLFFLSSTVFIGGSLLLESLAGLYRKLDARINEPLSLLRTVWRSWWLLMLTSTLLLSLPIGTRSAVPDYRHSFWNHVLDNAFAAASSACLVGGSVYNVGEEYSFFGQTVLVLTTLLAGVGFSAVGLAMIRPFLRSRVRLRSVLLWSCGLQLAAAAIMLGAWHDTDAASPAARAWWGIVHAGSAIWNSGTLLRADGLAPYLQSRTVFMCITTLAIIGSLGMPVLLDLFKRARPADSEVARSRKVGSDPRTITAAYQRLPQLEALAALILLGMCAMLLFYFETPRALPSTLVPDRPFDLGPGRVAMRDMTSHGDRWTAAVFVSGSLRSAGLQSVPVSQGALSWPSFGIMLIWMTIGGSVGGMAGGMRASALLLPMICLLSPKRAWGGRTGGPSLRRFLLKRVLLFCGVWLIVCVAAVVVLGVATTTTPYERAFEGIAAVNGVGLTTGLSIHLTPAGRLVMIGLFIAGRFGPAVFWLWLAGRVQRHVERDAPQVARAARRTPQP